MEFILFTFSMIYIQFLAFEVSLILFRVFFILFSCAHLCLFNFLFFFALLPCLLVFCLVLYISFAFVFAMSGSSTEIDSDSAQSDVSTDIDEFEDEIDMKFFKDDWVSPPYGKMVIMNARFDSSRVGYSGGNPIGSVSDAYHQLVDDSIFDFIARQTNIYAAQALQKAKSEARQHHRRMKTRIAQWKQTSAEEMKTYFGIILYMGTHKVY